MLILKSRDGSLYALRGEGPQTRLVAIPPSGISIIQTPGFYSPRSTGVHPTPIPGDMLDCVEALEPEGEAGALTRAVLEYRDAREAALMDGRRDYDVQAPVRLYMAEEKIIALAEAIADRAEVDALEEHQ